ncbi:hypothetical protein ACN20G_00080 [Streptomyces sp. BI20]|uniref:hypothetical protein n=1 Tax=Streptomyces sp. BI20 TaxID=3403460 RepID=UPI003C7906F9
MPRLARTVIALLVGVLGVSACSANPPAPGAQPRAAELAGADDPTAFARFAVEVTRGCPPLDGAKTGDPLGPETVPDLPRHPSGRPTAGADGAPVPLPAEPRVTAGSGTARAVDPLAPVSLEGPELCQADKFTAHAGTALRGIAANPEAVRAALRRAGYPEERIVAMSPDGKSPRVRLDLRLHDTRIALAVTQTDNGPLVEAFGTPHGVPVAEVRQGPGGAR